MTNREPLTAEIWPDPYQVEWDRLEAATTEEPFLQAAFELLKEASILLIIAASLSTDETPHSPRNDGIVLGHLVRMSKLTRTSIRAVVNDDGGDQQMQIVRQFLDSASVVAYILERGMDAKRCDAYVNDSLIAEREFLTDVTREIEGRGAAVLPIEMRIQRSIARSFTAAGVDPDKLPPRRKNAWPSAQERMRLLGPTAYSAYRMGSGSLHGSWHDIERNHLELDDGDYVPDFAQAPVRPQPLLAMVTLGAQASELYVRHRVGELGDDFEMRTRDLLGRTRGVDELHERFLTVHQS